MANAFVITHGTAGDLLPLIGVGKALAADGHRVTVLTHSPYRDVVVGSGMDFVAIDTEEQYAQELLDTQRLNADVFRRPMAVAQFYERFTWFDQIRTEFTTLVDRHVPGDTVVVARHSSGVSALMAAETLGVPVAWVAVCPTQIQSLPLMEKMYRYTIGARMNKVRAEFGLPPIHDWVAWYDRPDLQIALWPDWFDKAGPASPANVHLTGFVSHDPGESGTVPPEAEDLLNSATPPVLIAGGTSMVTHDNFYSTAAEGCARAGRTGLLVCPHPDMVPQPLPPGIRWFRRLPFREVIPRVSAVIHHGGIGTLARASASRTPQIILPCNFDRPDNAARLAHLGLAEWLPVGQWTPERVAEALERRVGRRLDPPAPIDSAASGRLVADLVRGLLNGQQFPGARRNGDALLARLRQLSPAQRETLRRRLTAANEGEPR
ncbi:nucleotide disphospho-sugar-binding domain-containing protein [Micromonospora sp. NPDC048999]|uniref:glycosyltransferase n=1 Tax=Micromonospora sp. NPDC048999 TaxID=3155391 RepID=UPI00340F93E4